MVLISSIKTQLARICRPLSFKAVQESVHHWKNFPKNSRALHPEEGKQLSIMPRPRVMEQICSPFNLKWSPRRVVWCLERRLRSTIMEIIWLGWGKWTLPCQRKSLRKNSMISKRMPNNCFITAIRCWVISERIEIRSLKPCQTVDINPTALFRSTPCNLRDICLTIRWLRYLNIQKRYRKSTLLTIDNNQRTTHSTNLFPRIWLPSINSWKTPLWRMNIRKCWPASTII